MIYQRKLRDSKKFKNCEQLRIKVFYRYFFGGEHPEYSMLLNEISEFCHFKIAAYWFLHSVFYTVAQNSNVALVTQ